jgi:hypothetical protein
MLKIPHCLDNRLTDGGEVVSLTHRSRSTPHKDVYLSLAFISVRGRVNPAPSSSLTLHTPLFTTATSLIKLWLTNPGGSRSKPCRRVLRNCIKCNEAQSGKGTRRRAEPCDRQRERGRAHSNLLQGQHHQGAGTFLAPDHHQSVGSLSELRQRPTPSLLPTEHSNIKRPHVVTCGDAVTSLSPPPNLRASDRKFGEWLRNGTPNSRNPHTNIYGHNQ